MLTINDQKIVAGHGFNTHTGVVPFIVVRVHRDGTITYASQACSYKLSDGTITARSADSMRATQHDFKRVYKEPVETIYERQAKMEAIAANHRKYEYERNKAHEQAQRMDLLIRASRGENLNALADEFEELVYDMIDEYGGY